MCVQRLKDNRGVSALSLLSESQGVNTGGQGWQDGPCRLSQLSGPKAPLSNHSFTVEW